MKIEILAEAEQDLLDGARFYERQEVGVGHHFIESLLADIRQYAGVHARDRGYHRMIAKRFPFAIFYRVTGDNILVYAVLDCRRSPAWLQQQLTRRERRNGP